MKNSVSVSCIIPIYNAEAYLHEFFDSLINQSFQDIEIICVNDASTDSSAAIIAEYQMKRELVLIENDTRLGAAVSRNKGLETAGGEYVIFLDCDDILHPEMLNRMYKCCENNAADMAICYLECFKGNRHIPIENMKGNQQMIPNYPIIESPVHFEHILQVLMNAPYDKMVRREMLLQNGIVFQNLPCTNDLFYSYSAALSANKIVFIDEVLYFIRYKREGGITATWSGKRDFVCEALDAVFDFASSKEIYEFVKKSFVNKAIKDIYNGLAGFSEVYRNETINNLRNIYLAKWGIMEWYTQQKLSLVQMKMIDNILYAKEMASYYSILLSCAEEKTIKFFSDCHDRDTKIIWWGAGNIGLEFLKYFSKLGLSVDYVVDRDTAKQGQTIAGYGIVGWESVIVEDCVILMTDNSWISDIDMMTGSSGKIINVVSYLEQ